MTTPINYVGWGYSIAGMKCIIKGRHSEIPNTWVIENEAGQQWPLHHSLVESFAIPPLNNLHRDVLEGALGLRHAKAPYRNHFLAGGGAPSAAVCEQLVGFGLMKKGELTRTGQVYHVTAIGAQAMGTVLPKD